MTIPILYYLTLSFRKKSVNFFIPISKTAKIAAFLLITLALELFLK